MPLPPYQVYRDQLTSLYHGHALWDPDPAGVYEGVSVGDVGYTRDGYFYRLFNVLCEWDDPSNCKLFKPECYPRLDLGPFVNIKESRFSKGDYHSRFVTAEEGTPYQATSPDDSPFTRYSCKRRQGALLTLPYDGLRQDVIRTKVFEEYIRDHVDSWFSMAQKHKLVDRMEDLILVTGCTLVTSWGAAAFVDSTSEAELSMRFLAHQNGVASFDWHENRPSVAFQYRYQDPHPDPGSIRKNQCVFIRGFRAKRVFIWTKLKGAAGPRPDDPDRRPEDNIQVMRVPDVPKYRDPLIGILDYIAEKCPDTGNRDIVAITHDDDVQLVESEEVDVLTADAVEGFLRRKEINVLIENGGAILQEEEEPVILDETKAIFYAVAELAGELVPLVLHPVLSKYFIKLDVSSQSIDHDYNLPNEELTSPAVHPPMPSLKLDNHQGYPQSINVQASSDSPGGVTVQDVLKTIQEDLRKPARRREWSKLNAEGQAAVDAAFRKRGRTEEELGQGLCRVDYLRGRNRLQILPKLSPDGEMLPAPTQPEEASRSGDPMQVDEPNVAGSSRTPAR